MKKPIKVKIDTVTKQTVVNYDNIVKGDTLQMTIIMYQNSDSLSLAGQTIRIILRKSDGYSVEKNNLTVSSGNSITINFDVQATLAPGEVLGEVQLKDANGTSISNKFIYEVDETLGDDIVIKSKDSIETLQDIQELIDDYNGNADALAQQNALATSNISSLNTKNATASSNISALNTQNTNATNNIATLTAKNSESVTNNNNLTDSIDAATTAKINLDNSKAAADASKVALDNSKASADDSKVALDASIVLAQGFINFIDEISVGAPVFDETGTNITTETGEVWTL